MAVCDIRKHNLIEASAGTGKTHIIENLFVDILKKTGTGIEKILAVTFTDKAAGELKKRIRENIKKAAETESDEKISQRLQSALCNFDQASIYTIHGFCNRILREFSFENDNLFTFEMVDDNTVYEKLLYVQMRSAWKERYKDHLEEILELSDFSNPAKFKKLILKAAHIFRQSSNISILPALNENFTEDVEAIRNEIGNFNVKIRSLLCYKKGVDEQNMEICNSFTGLMKEGSVKKFKRDFFSSLSSLLSCEEKSLFIKTAFGFYRNHNTPEKKSSVDYFDSIVLKEKRNEAELFFSLAVAIDEFFGYLESNESKISGQLAVQTADILKKDSWKYKKQNGLISFDDMIVTVNDALKNKSFNELMRKKYDYCVVDEFQDTDFLQWNIIKSIFPHDGKGRLFLIADPKQAIYGFRGADIFTYFTAKKEMSRLYLSDRVDLDTNYRIFRR
jgi:exodeoxyribonuclease V beta subunit